MIQSQIDHGNKKLAAICAKYKIDEQTAVRLLLDINELREFWAGVNAEDFLYSKYKKVE